MFSVLQAKFVDQFLFPKVYYQIAHALQAANILHRLQFHNYFLTSESIIYYKLGDHKVSIRNFIILILELEEEV